MKLVPFERGDSGLSNGVHYIIIRYDHRKLWVGKDRTIDRPAQVLNFSPLLESGIHFIGVNQY